MPVLALVELPPASNVTINRWGYIERGEFTKPGTVTTTDRCRAEPADPEFHYQVGPAAEMRIHHPGSVNRSGSRHDYPQTAFGSTDGRMKATTNEEQTQQFEGGSWSTVLFRVPQIRIRMPSVGDLV
ncbi:hypothetical protein ACLI4Y_07590 [Natrialbaceae archaeon A-CW3]